MEDSLKLEGLCKLTESKKVEGIAAFPRLSRNNRFYHPKVLAQLDGMTVPLLFHHDGTPEKVNDVIPANKIIGEATMKWNNDLQQLHYEGKVKEEYLPFLSQFPTLGASLGAHFRNERICMKSGCFDSASDMILEELSLTPTAGMPETTMKLTEAVESECKCHLSPVEKAIESLDPVSKMKYRSHLN